MEPAARREQTKVQNRQVILAAAQRVFAAMGFGAANVRDIIRATPLAAGTFYNYIKSKEEVYQALRDEGALAVRPSLHEARARATTAEEFLSGSFGILFEFVAQHRTGFQPPAGEARLRMYTPEVLAGFEELRADIEDAVARGLFPDIDADLLMAAMAGVGFEISERLRLAEGGDAQAAAKFATALFLGGIDALPRRGA